MQNAEKRKENARTDLRETVAQAMGSLLAAEWLRRQAFVAHSNPDPRCRPKPSKPSDGRYNSGAGPSHAIPA